MRLQGILLAGLCALGPVAVHAQSADALAWLRKIHDATQKLSYSGTFVYQNGSRSETSRITRYVDSGGDKTRPVLIQTEHGDVRDIGTQFEVRAERSSLRVRVREGEVIVDRPGSSLSARAGELLRLDPQGAYERVAVPLFGVSWPMRAIAVSMLAKCRTFLTTA